jgi:hypothetical protein
MAEPDKEGKEPAARLRLADEADVPAFTGRAKQAVEAFAAFPGFEEPPKHLPAGFGCGCCEVEDFVEEEEEH